LGSIVYMLPAGEERSGDIHDCCMATRARISAHSAGTGCLGAMFVLPDLQLPRCRER
jgi:hypothetical protein